jgi:hypothetical protein
MSLPTIHWHHFHGVLTTGQSVTIPHTLRTGEYPNGVTPDAVEFDMDPAGIYMEAANIRIGEYQARTSQNVYLSNWDPASRLGAHFYSIIVRRFHSYSGQSL